MLMKTFKRIAITAIALLSVACGKEVPPDALLLTSTEIKVGQQGIQQDLKFVTNAAWTLECNEKWLVFDKRSGDAGEATVKMTVPANDTYEVREATVIIKAGDKETTLKIVQDYLTEFTTETVYDLDNRAQVITYTLTSNITYEVIIGEGADWITYVPAPKGAPVTDVINFEIAESSVEDRSGYVVIKAGEYAHKLVINQSLYIDMIEVEASFIGTRMFIYNTSTNTYNEFDEYYLSFTNEDDDAMTLALNSSVSETPLAGIPTGDYLVDASAEHLDKTFSLAAPDGSIRYYTSFTTKGKEKTVIDGMVSVINEGGTYTIKALLYDESGDSYNFRYVGTIDPIVDNSFGADGSATFSNQYDTYFTTKANKWNIMLQFSGKPNPEIPKVNYLQFNIFGSNANVAKEDITEGVYTLAFPELDPNITYANGKLLANTGDLTGLGGGTKAGNNLRAKEGTTAKVTISKNEDGTYKFAIEATLEEFIYDWDNGGVVVVKGEFAYNAVVDDVVIGKIDETLGAEPDRDAVFSSVMASQYVSLFWGDVWSTGGAAFTIGFTAVNGYYTVYLTINQSDAYVYEKNFLGRFCNTPIQEGEYVYTKTPAAGQLSLVPVRYGTSTVYTYVQNTYTGSKMTITGGSVNLSSTTITYNIQATLGEKVYNFTGSHPAEHYYARDYTARAKNLHILE